MDEFVSDYYDSLVECANGNSEIAPIAVALLEQYDSTKTDYSVSMNDSTSTSEDSVTA